LRARRQRRRRHRAAEQFGFAFVDSHHGLNSIRPACVAQAPPLARRKSSH
jgi:hypothetical protein